MIDPIRLQFDVDCTVAHAFAIWTARTSAWWPASHSVSTEPGLRVVFEPRVGGRIYERTTVGVEHDWGRITVWDPPHRLVYQWHLRADAADATEVAITFQPRDGERTLVQIEHRGWERLGAKAAARRERNLAGWDSLLPHYVEATTDPDILRGLPGG
jgi:uncharacterized protein YndB with AHSA1/START domain